MFQNIRLFASLSVFDNVRVSRFISVSYTTRSTSDTPPGLHEE